MPPLLRVHLTLTKKLTLLKNMDCMPGFDCKKFAEKYGISKPIVNQSPIKFKTKEVSRNIAKIEWCQ